MGTLFITGNWEGALRSGQDGPSVPFSLRQSTAADSALATGPQFRIGNGVADGGRLLEGTSRSLVALVDEDQDAVSGATGQWLVDARLRNNMLVGHWVHRGTDGNVLGSGELLAERTTGA